jgi:Cu2+-exporting ATPase
MTAACPACTVDVAASAPALKDPDILLSLPGVHCAACIGTVERALKALPGVTDARVNLTLKRVAVETQRPEADLVAALRREGYEAHPLNAAALGVADDPAGRDLLLRLGIAGFAMMNVMLLSVAVWSGAADATRDLFHLISAAISLPVVMFSGQPFFRSAWSALRVARLNMDVPISLAILLAAGMSLFEALEGGAHAYFDAALSLTFFLLIGRYLDHRTRAAAQSAAKELAALEVHTATRLRDGQSETVDVAALRPGDRVLIPTGVRVPVDGRLLDREAVTDRSFLTGESAAVRLSPGDAVQAGEVNLGAPVRIEATAVGEDTTLRRIARLVETAETARTRYTALADRAAQIYAPAVHLLAFAAFAGWFSATGDARLALNIAIAVLIITCPCALGLAVPAVSTAAIGKLYAMGFLVKSGTALERLAEADRVVLDKTGTLTLPGAAVTALTDEQKAVARALAQASDHPVSRAVLRATEGIAAAPVTGIVEHPGLGVEGRLGDAQVRLGKGSWIDAEFAGTGLSIGGETVAVSPEERLREGAAEAVAALAAEGLHPTLLTGDRAEAAEAVAARLRIPFTAERSGEDKHAALAALANEGHRVAMIGDGLNDAAALAAAHASVAPSSALDASRNAADVVVLRESFEGLPALFRIARASVALSRQNFAIAAVYNVIAVPVALLGHATPLLAALAMSASSLTVLANALRVRRVQ